MSDIKIDDMYKCSMCKAMKPNSCFYRENDPVRFATCDVCRVYYKKYKTGEIAPSICECTARINTGKEVEHKAGKNHIIAMVMLSLGWEIGNNPIDNALKEANIKPFLHTHQHKARSDKKEREKKVKENLPKKRRGRPCKVTIIETPNNEA